MTSTPSSHALAVNVGALIGGGVELRLIKVKEYSIFRTSCWVRGCQGCTMFGSDRSVFVFDQ